MGDQSDVRIINKKVRLGVGDHEDGVGVSVWAEVGVAAALGEDAATPPPVDASTPPLYSQVKCCCYTCLVIHLFCDTLVYIACVHLL